MKNNLNSHTKKNLVCLGVLLIVSIFVGSYWAWNNRSSPDINYSIELSDSTALESHILVAGDIYWGREMKIWSENSKEKEKYPFSRLNEFQPELYDAWIGNLECPSVSGVNVTFEEEKEKLKFNCPTEYLSEASKWFDVFSLANNHTQNQDREKGLDATRKVLNDNKIQYFGNFNPHIKKDVCEVISLPARAAVEDDQKQVSIPVAMCGFHGVYYTITEESIAVMKEYSKYMPVMAFPHMGQEYQAVADKKREELYKKMIDNGADVVFGNHPHWVQPTEVYKSKLIVYSMGNFIFDQQFSTEVMRSAAIDVTLSVDKSNISKEKVESWINIGDECRSFQDNCLSLIQQQNLHPMQYELKYGIVGVDTSGQITHKADYKTYEEILERLNWKETQVK